MSEKNLPEMTFEETAGFKSALFLNICDMYSPKEILDSVESSRLSIESWTPGSTPKGAEKRKNESNFRYCLSRDLLQRLEEASPISIYQEKNEINSEIYLQGCDEVNEVFENDYTEKVNSHLKNTNENLLEDVVRCLNFSEESEELKNKIDTNANSSSGSTNSSVNSTGNISTINSLKFNSAAVPYFPHSKNNKFNKFNPICNFNFYNIRPNNVNMYGKNGWICPSCQNFNYESNFFII